MIGGVRIWLGAALGAGLMATPAYWLGHMRGFDAGSLAYEVDMRRQAEETRERLRDAETSTGDELADLDYLRCIVIGVCADPVSGAARPR